MTNATFVEKPRVWLGRSTLAAVLVVVWMFPGVGRVWSQEATEAAAENASVETILFDEGVRLPTGATVVLPRPALRGGSGTASLPNPDVLEDIAGRFGWERFARENLNAPTQIAIDPIEIDGRQLGYSVHHAYVVYASLDQIRDRQLMESLFGTEVQEAKDERDLGAQETRELSEQDLAELPFDVDSEKERLVRIELPLLRKVLVRGVIRLTTDDLGNGVELAWVLDGRFSNPVSSTMEKWQNTWSQLSTNDLGALVEGAPSAYRGMAGYMAIYETGKQEGQLLVETHMLIHEPQDWFGGSRYLRSKLPLSLQESAKSLRRKFR